MKTMTYAEVIGWEPPAPPDKGSLTDFLGGPPAGKVRDYGVSDTIEMSDETTYFAEKEVNAGDILKHLASRLRIVFREQCIRPADCNRQPKQAPKKIYVKVAVFPRLFEQLDICISEMPLEA